MKINFTFRRTSDKPAHKIKCRIIGNPLSAVLAVLAITCVVGFAWSVTKYVRDSYFPYEGEVVAITRSWMDWLLLENNDQEHLTIRTPAA